MFNNTDIIIGNIVLDIIFPMLHLSFLVFFTYIILLQILFFSFQ